MLITAAIAVIAQKPAAPPPQPQQPQQEQQNGGYEGSVVSITGEPIADARVILRSVGQGGQQQTQNTISGLNGKFTFSQALAGIRLPCSARATSLSRERLLA